MIQTVFSLVIGSWNILNLKGSTGSPSPVPGPGQDILKNPTLFLRVSSKLSLNSGRPGARAKLFHQESNNLLTKMFEVKHAHKINKRSLLSDADERVG